MKTPAVPHLPRPPDITRASCPDPRCKPINYLADYLWKRNLSLGRYFFSIFHDFRYGYCKFPDKTLDYGEIKYDGTDLTINIEGTEYDKVWTVPTQVFDLVDEDPNIVRYYGYDCDPDASSSEAWDMYDADPQSSTHHFALCNFTSSYTWPDECGGGVGYRAGGNKLFLKFDTTDASPNPVSAKITFTGDARNFTELPNPTLRLYSQDYGDVVDTGDWTGGDLAQSYLLDIGNGLESVDVEMSIDTGYVNIGGWSKFKLNFKEIDTNTHPSSGGGFLFQNITSIKLTLTY